MTTPPSPSILQRPDGYLLTTLYAEDKKIKKKVIPKNNDKDVEQEDDPRSTARTGKSYRSSDIRKLLKFMSN